MDRKKIYELLCELIKEAELGKKECLREDFEEWRLCDHALENTGSLVDKIGDEIMREHRTMIKLRRVELLSEIIDSENSSIKNFTECNDVTGKSRKTDNDISFEDRPFSGIL